MELLLTGRNLYIADKKAVKTDKFKIEGMTVEILSGEEILSKGKIDLGKDAYACLFCKQLKNITFIIQKAEVYSTSLIMADESEFEKILEQIKMAYPALELSEQNAKINGYAASVVEKLQEGIMVTIMDTKQEARIKYCPVCGMQCDPNIPYCMECGASV